MLRRERSEPNEAGEDACAYCHGETGDFEGTVCAASDFDVAICDAVSGPVDLFEKTGVRLYCTRDEDHPLPHAACGMGPDEHPLYVWDS